MFILLRWGFLLDTHTELRLMDCCSDGWSHGTFPISTHRMAIVLLVMFLIIHLSSRLLPLDGQTALGRVRAVPNIQNDGGHCALGNLQNNRAFFSVCRNCACLHSCLWHFLFLFTAYLKKWNKIPFSFHISVVSNFLGFYDEVTTK